MQKTEVRTDHNRHQENFYQCPACNQMVSGRVSWFQRGKQFHYKCLNRCAAQHSHECQYREKERGDLCDSPRRCHYKHKGIRNQCDGCNSRMKLNDGIHMDANGKTHMVCQKDKYC